MPVPIFFLIYSKESKIKSSDMQEKKRDNNNNKSLINRDFIDFAVI